MIFRSIAYLFLFITISSCSERFKYEKVEHRFENDVESFESAVLYEGLPHQYNERELLAKELKSQKSIDLYGYPFYTEILTLNQVDIEKLIGLYVDDTNFEPYEGPKECGGYHPDYCLKFSSGEKHTFVQFCFGCLEMKVFQDSNLHHCDVKLRAQDQLKAILNKYQKNRPTPNDG